MDGFAGLLGSSAGSKIHNFGLTRSPMERKDVCGEDGDEMEQVRGDDQGLSRLGLNDVVEPIMDASFQDDFDDIHSEYQWFTESG
ncbi:unnamed protein product, partial [Allacma fusca]